MPSCDHTGTPRHFHSSITSGSACLMIARIRASVSPRQSPSSLIRPSINREEGPPPVASSGPLLLPVGVGFFMLLSLARHAGPAGRRTSIRPRQNLLQAGKEFWPAEFGALVGLLLVRPEADLFHAQVSAGAGRGESPGDDTL